MGYTLKIGNAKIFYDGGEYPYCCIDVEFKHDKNAPAFNEPTDYENQTWPSYTSWHDFSMFAGLYDLFYSKEDGLISCHPGSTPLTKKHKEIIDNSYKLFKEKYPKSTPTYGKAKDFEDDPNNPIENSWLCRLEWLKYWVDWALENCDKPIFYNSQNEQNRSKNT